MYIKRDEINYKTNTFLNGLTKGGFIEWVGLRPENKEVEQEMRIKKADTWSA